MQGDDLVTVNFTSFDPTLGQTFDEGILGKVWSDISFGGDWDAGINIFSAPAIYPRDDLQSVLLYTSVIDATFWTFPYMRVRNSDNGGEVNGKVTMTAAGKSQGAFTGPGGITFPENVAIL